MGVVLSLHQMQVMTDSKTINRNRLGWVMSAHECDNLLTQGSPRSKGIPTMTTHETTDQLVETQQDVFVTNGTDKTEEDTEDSALDYALDAEAEDELDWRENITGNKGKYKSTDAATRVKI